MLITTKAAATSLTDVRKFNALRSLIDDSQALRISNRREFAAPALRAEWILKSSLRTHIHERRLARDPASGMIRCGQITRMIQNSQTDHLMVEGAVSGGVFEMIRVSSDLIIASTSTFPMTL